MVKKFRNFITVQDADGTIEKYRPCDVKTPKSKPKAKQTAKPKLTSEPKSKKALFEEKSARLPKFTIRLERLTNEKIAQENAKLKRNAKIRRIQNAIKNMPGRIVS